MSDQMAKRPRPLAPNIQIYRPQLTSVLSIVNRITGVLLSVCAVVLVIWLIAAATGEAYFDWVSWFFGTLVGRLILFGYTWALMHHMLGGLRHFMWDMGRGYEKHFSTRLALLTPVVSVALTVLIWIAGYLAR